ncbi:MAG: zinc ribbon domain-containing protein [Clostridia bacterium]|nr:zinc ribbon domain-containing protein [Clostridia bacterium]
MPLLQYTCENCGNSFEELVKKYDDQVLCPKCGTVAKRSYCGTVYSATGKKVVHCSGHCATCDGCK